MEKITYKKSFTAKMVLAGNDTISVYQIIKDLCSTHKDVKTRLSFNYETINYKRNKIGVMKIARKNLSLYLNLEPKDFIGSKYKFEDVSDKKSYENYKMMLKLKSKKSIKDACELLELMFKNVGATTIVEALDVDYNDVFYSRSFEDLVLQGFIKKYVRKKIDGKTVIVEELPKVCHVNFTAKLLYDATDEADNLYIITSYDNWNLDKAILMKKNADGSFIASCDYPLGTKLEFKICRSEAWTDVEKGIWKEEIVNHNYVLIDEDKNIEDLIYNFRQ